MDAGTLRFKAPRPQYRRGGLLLSSSHWVMATLADLGDANLLALLADPIVVVQGEVREGEWEAPPADIRAGVVAVLKSRLGGQSDNPPEGAEAETGPATGGAERAAGTGETSTAPVVADPGEGAQQAGGVEPASDAGGATLTPPVNDPPAASNAPIGGPAAEPVATAPAKPAAKTGGKVAGTKAETPRKPAAKQPASAPKAAE